MGVWNAAGGEITSRSVCGVKAKAGRPGSELLAGVVAALAVVRLVLSTQVASASLLPRSASRRSHRVAAEACMLPAAQTPKAAATPDRMTRERYMQFPQAVFSFSRDAWLPIRAASRVLQQPNGGVKAARRRVESKR